LPVKVKSIAKLSAVLLGGIVLGWIVCSAWNTRQLSVDQLTTSDITLTDSHGRRHAELKADGEKTYLVFFDASNRPRLTLNLDKQGPSIALNGREDRNKIVFSVDDSLRTASIFISALTTGINLVGFEEARLKLSDSVITDARSASLNLGPRVTKLRLSSNGAESELRAENELTPRKAGKPSSVELDMRTAKTPSASLRVSSEAEPNFELLDSNGSKICGCPLPQRRSRAGRHQVSPPVAEGRR
jgi:hypothetical protein